ncbi:MAG: response regulator [Chitinophagia bacterium]|nr:response regulator [Chitinophagia bacterium]
MIDAARYQELQYKLSSQPDEKGRIEVLFEIAEEIKSFDADKAMQIADEVIQRSRTVAFPRWLGRGLCLKGSCYSLKGEYEHGITVLKEALAMATKTKYTALEARVLFYLGNIYKALNDLPKMLTYFERALNIAEELGDEYSQSEILTSISNLLYDLNDFDTALDYALKCLPIFEKGSNSSSLVNIYNTLGNIFFKKEQYKDALLYFQGILDHSEPGTPPHNMAESGLGKVYFKMQEYEHADKYLTSSLRNAQHMGNMDVQIIAHFYLGCLYIDAGHYSLAFRSLNMAYKIATEHHRKHDLMSIHEVMSKLYDIMGDIPNAYHHLKTNERLKEEIFKQKIINELRNLQIRQQVELAKKEKEVAENTALLKHQFLANMSHEIRTPMNAIVGMTRLLISNNPREDQQKYIDAIRQSADNLLVIINDILDLSKIEAGKIVIEQIDFSLADVLKGLRDMLLFKAEEKKLVLKVVHDEYVPNLLNGDPTRLNQILVNLAGNALKFTEKGSVEVNCSICKKEDTKVWLQFDVTDTGIGIAQNQIDNIFENFTQAGSDTTRKYGGTGLGLSICRQLSTLMQGDISVRSEIGKGTTFSVVLPFEYAKNTSLAPTAQKEITDADKQMLSKLKVLLVEDNELNQMVAMDTLQESLPGIAIDTALNGLEACRMVKNNNYDLVLMDIQMPIMDGVAATQTIRNSLKPPQNAVKIIAMTANVLQDDVRSYLNAGMDSYVSKPFNTQELLIKMKDCVENKSALAAEVIQQINEHPAAIVASAKPAANAAGKPLPLPTPVIARQPTEPIAKPFQNQPLPPAPQPTTLPKAPAPLLEERTPAPLPPPALPAPAVEMPPAQPAPAIPAPAENGSPVAPAAGKGEIQRPVTDKNFLVKLTGGNPEKMQKYIRMFLENAPKLLNSIDTALANKDYKAVKIAAHSLKPQLSYMGVKEEISNIFLIEQSAGEAAHHEVLPEKVAILKKVCDIAFKELSLSKN